MKKILALLVIMLTVSIYAEDPTMKPQYQRYEGNPNAQMWEATYSDDRPAILMFIHKGANVNLPDQYGSIILSRYVITEMMDYNKKRANFIIDLLAAGANPLPVAGHIHPADKVQPYLDQPQVLVILKNMLLSPEEEQHIRTAANALVRATKNTLVGPDIRRLLNASVIQNIINEKLNKIKANVPAEDWESYDKAKLQKALELNITKILQGK